jgi:hypothetical protein
LRHCAKRGTTILTDTLRRKQGQAHQSQLASYCVTHQYHHPRDVVCCWTWHNRDHNTGRHPLLQGVSQKTRAALRRDCEGSRARSVTGAWVYTAPDTAVTTCATRCEPAMTERPPSRKIAPDGIRDAAAIRELQRIITCAMSCVSRRLLTQPGVPPLGPPSRDRGRAREHAVARKRWCSRTVSRPGFMCWTQQTRRSGCGHTDLRWRRAWQDGGARAQGAAGAVLQPGCGYIGQRAPQVPACKTGLCAVGNSRGIWSRRSLVRPLAACSIRPRDWVLVRVWCAE